MTFSEFARILYPYLGKGETERDYLIRLTDKIMGGRPGRSHQDGGYQNPLRGKDDRILQYYFTGKRNIPQSHASMILSSVDKDKFNDYLVNQCSNDALEMLAKDLSNFGINVGKNLVPQICTDLFVEILHNLATVKST